ncbi:MAG: class I SAM-dependent methyltransferase [Saprospiraceae bacterium]|nr:class I SAM-dependent methyltransferase [Saprospiraceae bacterium]
MHRECKVDSCLFTRSMPKTLYQFWQRAYAQDLISFAHRQGCKSFLELGCGRATTSMYLADSGQHNITLVDLSEEARNLAESNFSRMGLRFPPFFLADVRATGLPTGHFDCIYNIGLLEHFDDPSEVLKETYRLLKPGGVIFMPIFPQRTPALAFVLRAVFNPLSFVKRLWGRGSSGEHHITRAYATGRYYENLCQDAGFAWSECMHYNPFPKVVRDCAYERKLVLSAYRLAERIRNRKFRDFSFRTNGFSSVGFLLIAGKQVR